MGLGFLKQECGTESSATAENPDAFQTFTLHSDPIINPGAVLNLGEF